jgi:alkaline phosphatase
MHTSRRQFLQTLALGAVAAGTGRAAWAQSSETLSFGVITDLHYSRIATRGRRYYSDSLAKLGQAVATFRERKLPLVFELGDLIDLGPSKAEAVGHLKAMREVLDTFPGQRRCVLGNHCVAQLSKEEFLAAWETPDAPTYYSLDLAGWHFVVLDADFLADGTPYRAGNFHWTDTWIPAPQQRWLADDLRRAGDRPTIVLVHQNLQDETKMWCVKNAPAVRKIFRAAGNVKAVLQGHLHEGGCFRVDGIPYFTFKGAVEAPGLAGNAYGIVTLGPGDRVSVEGFGRQASQVVR